MKIIPISLLCSFVWLSCNSSRIKNPEPINPVKLSGKTFACIDTTSSLTGLHFESDSIMVPRYNVTFDTLIIWKYKIINNSLHRYTTATNELIGKDSIISHNDSLLVLGSFVPDSKQKITFKLVGK